MQSIIFKGLGRYLPETRVTNEVLSQRVDTSDEWIRTRTGIGERRIAQAHETVTFMGTQAAQQALEQAGLKAEQIDLLIVATMSPEMLTPSTACLIQKHLGTRGGAFDIQAACSGFVYALDIATQMLRSGAYQHILVIGTEKLSSFIDWEDRSTCVLFGDGAGAAVLGTLAQTGVGILKNTLGADGQGAGCFEIPAGGSLRPACQQTLSNRDHYIKMNGRELFKTIVPLLEQETLRFLTAQNLTLADIDWIIPHQANVRILESLCKRLDYPMEQVFLNLEHYGNTSAASIPLALMEALEQKKVLPGQTLLLMAFGAGLTWGFSLIKWPL